MVLNLPTANTDQMDENKMQVKISLSTVFLHKYFLKHQLSNIKDLCTTSQLSP